MPLEILIALASFSIVAAITPGPNNIMLLTSGVNYGFRRSLPHMFGISGGFGVLLISVGLGLAQVFQVAPSLFIVIKFCGAAYLLYLAWRIAMSGPISSGGSQGRPMTFLEAAIFQWVNPKAWVMAVTAMAVYTQESSFYASVGIVAAMFMVVSIPSVAIWCGFGVALRDWLSDSARLRAFNITMAVLLVLSLWPMLR